MLSFPYYLLAEWVCFIASILLVSGAGKYWRSLQLYLLLVVAVESICYYMAWIARQHNQWVYNLFLPFEYGYGIWILSRSIYIKNLKIITAICGLIVFGSYIQQFISQGGITVFFDRTDTIGSVIMIGLCMIYYYTLFQQDEYVDLMRDALFWFITGYFIFYTTGTVVDTFFEKLVQIRVHHHISLRYVIM